MKWIITVELIASIIRQEPNGLMAYVLVPKIENGSSNLPSPIYKSIANKFLRRNEQKIEDNLIEQRLRVPK